MAVPFRKSGDIGLGAGSACDGFAAALGTSGSSSRVDPVEPSTKHIPGAGPGGFSGELWVEFLWIVDIVRLVFGIGRLDGFCCFCGRLLESLRLRIFDLLRP